MGIDIRDAAEGEMQAPNTGLPAFEAERAASLRAKILAEQVRQTYEVSLRTMVFNVLFGLMVSAVVWGVAPDWMVIAYTIGILLVFAGRVSLLKFYMLSPPRTIDEARTWGDRYVFSSFFNGLVWAIFGFFFLQYKTENWVILATIYAGIILISPLSNGTYIRTYYFFAIPIAISSVLALLLMHTPTDVYMAIIYLGGAIVAVSYAQQYNKTFTTAVQRELENRDLADRANEARKNEGAARDEVMALLQRQQAILEAVPVPLFVKDTNLKFQSCNSAFEKFIGLPRIRIEGFLSSELTSGDWAQQYEPAEKQLLAKGGQSALEGTVVDIDGDLREVMVNHAALPGRRSDQPIGLVGAIVDVTEQRRATRELIDTQQRFQLYLDLSPVAAVLVRLSDNQITYANPAMAKMAGGDPANPKSAATANFLYSLRRRDEMIARIVRGEEVEAEESLCQRPDGSLVWAEVTIGRTRHRQEELLIWWFYDLTERKQSEQKLSHMAMHDALTGLPNRVLFHEQLQIASARASRGDSQLALMYFDLDGFKAVNDTLGHEFGDMLLKEIGARLKSCLRDNDVLARLGGDEFAMIVDGKVDHAGLAVIAQKVIEKVQVPVEIDGRTGRVSVSIGIAVFPDDGKDGDALVRSADSAMYSSKQAGRATFTFAQDVSPEKRRNAG